MIYILHGLGVTLVYVSTCQGVAVSMWYMAKYNSIFIDPLQVVSDSALRNVCKIILG